MRAQTLAKTEANVHVTRSRAGGSLTRRAQIHTSGQRCYPRRMPTMDQPPRMKRTLRVLATLLWLHAGASNLGAQEPISPELEALLERLLELRSEESRLLENLTGDEREVVLEALERRLAAAELTDPEPRSPTKPSPPAATVVPEIDAVGLPARCNTLLPFDSNGDGRFSGADRHYRNFRLWRDTNGNGTLEEGELESLLPAGVRSLELDLRSYVTDRKDSASGEVFVGDTIEIELLAKRGRPEIRTLGLDTDSLASDGFHFEDDQGAPLTGIVILRPGLAIVTAGERLELDCP